MYGTMTAERAQQVEARVTPGEAELWLRMLEFAAAPVGSKPPRDYDLARRLGVSPGRENELLEAVFLTVEAS